MVIPVTRGPRTGPCNICGVSGLLTEDHTPPKGCVRPTGVMLKHAVDRLQAAASTKGRLSQNGVKYRTLCNDCNSGLLGGRYDPALIDFANTVAGYLASQLMLPEVVAIKTKPQLLARSVFGHIAAQGVDRYQKGPRTEEWARFFQDETLPMPEGMHLYYWIYPYRRQVLMRDAVIGQLGLPGAALMWMMKFYPLAFLIWQSNTGLALKHRDLSVYRSAKPDDEIDVMLDLRPVPHELLLEAPRTDQLIMYGQEAVIAEDQPVRGRVIKLRKQ